MASRLPARGRTMKRSNRIVPLLALIASSSLHAQDAKLDELEKKVQGLQQQIDAERAQRETREQALLAELARAPDGTVKVGERWYEHFTLGGYGEIHYRQTAGSGRDQIDLTRFVGYIGYRFADWIQLHSEIEIEHALVAPDGEGELSVEQAHFDFQLSDAFGIRAGRFLTPLGIVN